MTTPLPFMGNHGVIVRKRRQINLLVDLSACTKSLGSALCCLRFRAVRVTEIFSHLFLLSVRYK